MSSESSGNNLNKFIDNWENTRSDARSSKSSNFQFNDSREENSTTNDSKQNRYALFEFKNCNNVHPEIIIETMEKTISDKLKHNYNLIINRLTLD